ncbi:hypothetical protein N7468_008436 [Penicillium chermesinum]|uniref:Uncharacterized protein n=1 Tax=Penicillium chermesinum TaxID=63820 RepID=A0A9W9TIN2_9EURO|nr:uncharacterized protein N7468_008436 [Penicillium chermesinum]KAJ5223894.1 hypothetical protein N7468_008436 [Penicillium chermesinum]
MRPHKRNKPRVLLALYAQPDQPEYPHYALLITPKFKPSLHQNLGDKEQAPIPATKYHVQKSRQNLQGELFRPWQFEKTDIADIDRDPGILVCTMIGKVLDLKRLKYVLPTTPVYQLNHPDQVRALNFDDHTWARDGYQELKDHHIIAGIDWTAAEEGANAFMRQKHNNDPWAAGCSEGRNQPLVPIVDLTSGCMLRT